MKTTVERNRCTIYSSDGSTAVIITEEDGTLNVGTSADVEVSNYEDWDETNGLELEVAPMERLPTLREQAFHLIEKHSSDDQSDAERREASKEIARTLFGDASRKSLQRVAAYKASYTRNHQN